MKTTSRLCDLKVLKVKTCEPQEQVDYFNRTGWIQCYQSTWSPKSRRRLQWWLQSYHCEKVMKNSRMERQLFQHYGCRLKKNHCHSCSLKSKDLPSESDLSKLRHFDRSQTGKSGLDLKSGNLSLQAMKQWWKPSQAVGSMKRTDVQPSNSSSFLIFLLQAIDVDVQIKLQKHCLTSGHQQTRFITHGRHHDWNHSQGGRMSSCPLFLQLSSNKNVLGSPNLSQTSFQFKVFTDDTLCIQQNLSDQKFQDHLTIAT